MWLAQCQPSRNKTRETCEHIRNLLSAGDVQGALDASNDLEPSALKVLELVHHNVSSASVKKFVITHSAASSALNQT